MRGVLHGTGIDQRARQEGADSVGHDGETTLHLTGDCSGNEFSGLKGFFQAQPGGQALGAVAGQTGFTATIFE